MQVQDDDKTIIGGFSLELTHSVQVDDGLKYLVIKELTIDFNTVTVINTHDMNSVVEIGDNIAFIYHGQKWWTGNNKEILTSDNTELNDFVFATKLMRSIKG
ncbi:MAG: hypothetical protein L3J56_10130 [Bacteroidales bacterium]|nr:hypothetical protein [Bacteroidales bacterium]